MSVADLLSARWDAGEAGPGRVWLPAGFEVTYAGPDGREVRAGLDRLRRADLGSCLPVRSFPSYQGAAELPGLVLVGDDGTARRVRIVGGARSPGSARLRPRGHRDRLAAVLAVLADAGGEGLRRHAPDFFARLAGAGRW